MEEREFWQIIRASLLNIVSAVEKRYGIGSRDNRQKRYNDTDIDGAGIDARISNEAMQEVRRG